MRWVPLFLASLVLGCSSAAVRVPQTKMDSPGPASKVPPTTDEQADLTEWHVHLDTRDRRLGAYTLVLHYNATVARIHQIQPCGVRRFKGSPEYDPSTFGSGMTRVTSLDAFPGRAPENEYHLITVIFRRTASGTLEAKAELEKVYDQKDKAIRARIIQPRFTYAFP